MDAELEPLKIELSKVQKQLEWLNKKLYLDIVSEKAKSRFVKRGQVYWCNLGVGVGSEKQKDRPCLIIQNNIVNNKSSNVIVMPITHTCKEYLSCIVPIGTQTDDDGNVILDGNINVSDIRCVSKARLGDYVAKISNAELRAVEIELAKIFDLITYYNDLQKRLENKIKYIENVKKQRNDAQDLIEEIRALVESDEDSLVIDKIKKLLNIT